MSKNTQAIFIALFSAVLIGLSFTLNFPSQVFAQDDCAEQPDGCTNDNLARQLQEEEERRQAQNAAKDCAEQSGGCQPDEEGGGGGGQECRWESKDPECDWSSNQSYEVEQNTCTGEYRRTNYKKSKACGADEEVPSPEKPPPASRPTVSCVDNGKVFCEGGKRVTKYNGRPSSTEADPDGCKYDFLVGETDSDCYSKDPSDAEKTVPIDGKVLVEGVSPQGEPGQIGCNIWRKELPQCDFSQKQVYDLSINACSGQPQKDNYQTIPGVCGAPLGEPSPIEQKQAIDLRCQSGSQSVYFCDKSVCIEKKPAWNGTTCIESFSNAESGNCSNNCQGNTESSGQVTEQQDKDFQCKIQFGQTEYKCADGGGCLAYSFGWDGSECKQSYRNVSNAYCGNQCQPGSIKDEVPDPALNFSPAAPQGGTQPSQPQAGPGPGQAPDIGEIPQKWEAGASCTYLELCDEGGVSGNKACRGTANDKGACEFGGTASCSECTTSQIKYNKNAYCKAGVCIGGPGEACAGPADCTYTLPQAQVAAPRAPGAVRSAQTSAVEARIGQLEGQRNLLRQELAGLDVSGIGGPQADYGYSKIEDRYVLIQSQLRQIEGDLGLERGKLQFLLNQDVAASQAAQADYNRQLVVYRDDQARIRAEQAAAEEEAEAAKQAQAAAQGQTADPTQPASECSVSWSCVDGRPLAEGTDCTGKVVGKKAEFACMPSDYDPITADDAWQGALASQAEFEALPPATEPAPVVAECAVSTYCELGNAVETKVDCQGTVLARRAATGCLDRCDASSDPECVRKTADALAAARKGEEEFEAGLAARRNEQTARCTRESQTLGGSDLGGFELDQAKFRACMGLPSDAKVAPDGSDFLPNPGPLRNGFTGDSETQERCRQAETARINSLTLNPFGDSPPMPSDCVKDNRSGSQRIKDAQEELQNSGDLDTALRNMGGIDPNDPRIKDVINGLCVRGTCLDTRDIKNWTDSQRDVFLREVDRKDPNFGKWLAESLILPLSSYERSQIAKDACKSNYGRWCDFTSDEQVKGGADASERFGRSSLFQSATDDDFAKLNPVVQQMFGGDSPNVSAADLKKFSADSYFCARFGDPSIRSRCMEEYYPDKASRDALQDAFDKYSVAAVQGVGNTWEGRLVSQRADEAAFDTALSIVTNAVDPSHVVTGGVLAAKGIGAAYLISKTGLGQLIGRVGREAAERLVGKAGIEVVEDAALDVARGVTRGVDDAVRAVPELVDSAAGRGAGAVVEPVKVQERAYYWTQFLDQHGDKFNSAEGREALKNGVPIIGDDGNTYIGKLSQEEIDRITRGGLVEGTPEYAARFGDDPNARFGSRPDFADAVFIEAEDALKKPASEISIIPPEAPAAPEVPKVEILTPGETVRIIESPTPADLDWIRENYPRKSGTNAIGTTYYDGEGVWKVRIISSDGKVETKSIEEALGDISEAQARAALPVTPEPVVPGPLEAAAPPAARVAEEAVGSGLKGTPEPSLLERIKSWWDDLTGSAEAPAGGTKLKAEQYVNSDLRSVGSDKPLGYLPLGTINRTPEGIQELISELEAKGLKTKLFSQSESNIGSGALFVYDDEALNSLIGKNKKIIAEAGWSTTAEGFVDDVASKLAPGKTPLFDVVADSFADYANPGRLTVNPQAQVRPRVEAEGRDLPEPVRKFLSDQIRIGQRIFLYPGELAYRFAEVGGVELRAAIRRPREFFTLNPNAIRANFEDPLKFLLTGERRSNQTIINQAREELSRARRVVIDSKAGTITPLVPIREEQTAAKLKGLGFKGSNIELAAEARRMANDLNRAIPAETNTKSFDVITPNRIQSQREVIADKLGLQIAEFPVQIVRPGDPAFDVEEVTFKFFSQELYKQPEFKDLEDLLGQYQANPQNALVDEIRQEAANRGIVLEGKLPGFAAITEGERITFFAIKDEDVIPMATKYAQKEGETGRVFTSIEEAKEYLQSLADKAILHEYGHVAYGKLTPSQIAEWVKVVDNNPKLTKQVINIQSDKYASVAEIPVAEEAFADYFVDVLGEGKLKSRLDSNPQAINKVEDLLNAGSPKTFEVTVKPPCPISQAPSSLAQVNSNVLGASTNQNPLCGIPFVAPVLNKVNEITESVGNLFRKVGEPEPPKIKVSEVKEKPEVDWSKNKVELDTQIQSFKNGEIDLPALISKTEEITGTSDQAAKLAESALLIDDKFLVTGVLRGDSGVERYFGDPAWADWLNARTAAKAYGEQPLTIDFIKDLHTRLTQTTDPKIGGKFRTEGVIGGDYTNLGSPVKYTDEQLEAIRNNPLLNFAQRGSDPNTGLIVYPSTTYQPGKKALESLSPEARARLGPNPSDSQLIEALLQDTADWYNASVKSGTADPYQLAAELQRRIISIHPFGDVNGRVSRALMDWSLENSGLAPARLIEPSDDIITSLGNWAEQVKLGSQRAEEMQKRAEAFRKMGYSDQAEILGVSQLKTFYDTIYSKIGEPPPLTPKPGEGLVHPEYEKFLKDIKSSMAEFNNLYAGSPVFLPNNYSSEMFQYRLGGLIPESYINLLSLKPADYEIYEKQIRDLFYSSAPVYRGGVLTDQITGPQDVLRLFEGYTAVGGGYSALGWYSPLSIRELPESNVAQALRQYNSLLANDYLVAKGVIPPSSENIDSVVQIHSAEGTSKSASPFASTSIDRNLSDYWARRFNLSTDAKYGVMIKSRSPNEGAFPTFISYPTNDNGMRAFTGVKFSEYPNEKEILIPGGINPSSIDYLVIYGRNTGDLPIFRAKKVVNDDGVFVEIIEKDGKSITYGLNPKSGSFEEIAYDIKIYYSPEVFSASIAQVATPAELVDLLEKIENIDGLLTFGNKRYSKDELINLINGYSVGQISIYEIPAEFGLRDKVKAIVASKNIIDYGKPEILSYLAEIKDKLQAKWKPGKIINEQVEMYVTPEGKVVASKLQAPPGSIKAYAQFQINGNGAVQIYNILFDEGVPNEFMEGVKDAVVNTINQGNYVGVATVTAYQSLTDKVIDSGYKLKEAVGETNYKYGDKIFKGAAIAYGGGISYLIISNYQDIADFVYEVNNIKGEDVLNQFNEFKDNLLPGSKTSIEGINYSPVLN